MASGVGGGGTPLTTFSTSSSSSSSSSSSTSSTSSTTSTNPTTTVTAAPGTPKDKENQATTRFNAQITANATKYPDIKSIKDVQYIETKDGKQGFKINVKVEVGGEEKIVSLITGDPDLVAHLLTGASSSTATSVEEKFEQIMGLAQASAKEGKTYSYNHATGQMHISGSRGAEHSFYFTSQSSKAATIQNKIDDINNNQIPAVRTFYQPFAKGRLKSKVKDLEAEKAALKTPAEVESELNAAKADKLDKASKTSFLRPFKKARLEKEAAAIDAQLQKHISNNLDAIQVMKWMGVAPP